MSVYFSLRDLKITQCGNAFHPLRYAKGYSGILVLAYKIECCMKRYTGVLVLLSLNFGNAFSQGTTGETLPEKITPKEFTIPASPVFDLMGVTPSQVTRLADIKDFKVDWSFKSWKLNPNLALQAQPVYELFYNRKELKKYQRASAFMRRLSSLDVSLGTVQTEENDRRIGFAAKLNAYRQKDPLLAKELYNDIVARYADEKLQLTEQERNIKRSLDTTTNILEKPNLRAQLLQTQEQLFSINTREKAEISARAAIYNAENWNASSVDIAFGKIFTYRTDSAGSLKKLRLNRNTALGAWVNAGFGLGKKLFFSGLVRTSFYEEELNFDMKDNVTDEVTQNSAVARNTLFTFGFNMRYGSAAYTFFAEFIHERKGFKTAVAALKDAFTQPAGSTIITSTVKWDIVQPYSVNIGGDWRVSRNVILNYGVRCVMNKQFKTTTVIPVASIACMMR